MKHFLKSDLFKKVLAAVVMVGIIIFVLIVKIPPHKNISNEKVNSLDLSTKEDSTLDSFVVDKEQVILEKKSEGSELNNKETTTVPEKINIPKETLSKNELVRASTNLIPVSVPTTTSETSVINNLPDPEIYLKMAMADLVANRLDSALTNLDKAIVVISPDSTHFKHLPADKLKFAIWLHGEVLWQLKTEQNEKGRINDEELSAAVKDVIYNFSEAIATDPQDIYRPSNERVLNRRALAYIPN